MELQTGVQWVQQELGLVVFTNAPVRTAWRCIFKLVLKVKELYISLYIKRKLAQDIQFQAKTWC